MSRLIVVSNRVAPIQEGEATTGGLAAGVLDALRVKGGLWLGWSGNIRDLPEQQPEQVVGAISLFTIDLSRQDYDQYYRGFANGTLWPVLHYQIGLARFEWPEYEGYRRVNGMFAQALAKLVREDDLIWVHDYQLLYVAEAARDAGLTNRIGLFLHTPFPPPGVFMTIPAHADLFRAVCRYDLLGFQTEIDRTAFIDYAVRYAGGAICGDVLTIYGGCAYPVSTGRLERRSVSQMLVLAGSRVVVSSKSNRPSHHSQCFLLREGAPGTIRNHANR
jgi:trehalose 6-phosphate synthase